MALSDELAYMSATELALRIRRRQLSPVEVVDAFLARIEARNPSLNAFVYFGFEDARQRAQGSRTGVDVRRGARPAARCPGGDQGPVRLQTGMGEHLRRRAGAQEQRRRLLLRVCRAHREGRRDPGRQDQQPGDGLSRHVRQLPVRPVAQSVQPGQEQRRVVGRQRGGRRRRHAAAGRRDRRRRLDPHPRVMVRRLRLQAVVRARAVRRPPQRVRRRRAVPVRGPDHPHGRGCRARPDARSRATIRAIPTASTSRWTSPPPPGARSGAGRSRTARISTCSRWIAG